MQDQLPFCDPFKGINLHIMEQKPLNSVIYYVRGMNYIYSGQGGVFLKKEHRLPSIIYWTHGYHI